MGNGSSKSGSHTPTGPKVDVMVRKYGSNCLDCLPYWTKTCGFPENGSFSISKLRMLKDSLEEQEKKLKKQTKIKTEDLKQLEKNKECFNMWMKEADSREKKQGQKQLTLLKTNDTDKKQASKPLIDFSSPLYPSIRDVDLILDVLLPPPYPPPHRGAAALPTAPPPLPPAPAQGVPFQMQTRSMQQAGHSNAEQAPGSATQSQAAAPPVPDKEEEKADLYPMLQVPTETGEIGLIYRPWTETDLGNAISHLPACKDSGKRFGTCLLRFVETFLPTMNEIRRLMLRNLGPMDYAKIKQYFPNELVTDPAITHPALNDDANRAFKNAVVTLTIGLETAFPDRTDMARINSTRQQIGEPTDAFLFQAD